LLNIKLSKSYFITEGLKTILTLVFQRWNNLRKENDMKKSSCLIRFQHLLFTSLIALCAVNLTPASANSHHEYQPNKIVSQTAYQVQMQHHITPYDYRPNAKLENVEAKKCYWLTPFQPSEGCQYQQQQNHYNVLLGKWRKAPPLSLQQKQFGVKVNL